MVLLLPAKNVDIPLNVKLHIQGQIYYGKLSRYREQNLIDEILMENRSYAKSCDNDKSNMLKSASYEFLLVYEKKLRLRFSF